jgi:transcriptional regulator with XRE-family HTH domain
MNSVEFGKHIENLRMRAGFQTREELGRMAGVWGSTIQRIEEGKTKNPSVEVLKKLAPPLKISFEELMEAAGYIEKNDTYIKLEGARTTIDLTHLSKEDQEYIIKLAEKLGGKRK